MPMMTMEIQIKGDSKTTSPRSTSRLAIAYLELCTRWKAAPTGPSHKSFTVSPCLLEGGAGTAILKSLAEAPAVSASCSISSVSIAVSRLSARADLLARAVAWSRLPKDSMAMQLVYLRGWVSWLARYAAVLSTMQSRHGGCAIDCMNHFAFVEMTSTNCPTLCSDSSSAVLNRIPKRSSVAAIRLT